jgi:hypothetical protein
MSAEGRARIAAATEDAMGEHKAEVIVKRCHSCLRSENLVPCGGNVDGACRNRNLLCPEHSRVKTILGKIQCPECYKSIPWKFGSL